MLSIEISMAPRPRSVLVAMALWGATGSLIMMSCVHETGATMSPNVLSMTDWTEPQQADAESTIGLALHEHILAPIDPHELRLTSVKANYIGANTMTNRREQQQAGSAAPSHEELGQLMKARALEEMFAFSDVMGLMALLGAPRFLARIVRELQAHLTRNEMIALLDRHVATIERAKAGDYADADGDLRRTEEPTRRARAAIATWEPSSKAPEPLIQAARDFFKAYGKGEPVVPWEEWDGDESKLPPRPPPPTLQKLRDEPLTLSEWLALEEPGELSNGILQEEEAAPAFHEAAIDWLMHGLVEWAAPRQILVRGPSHKLGINETTGYKPDISVYVLNDEAHAPLSTTARAPCPTMVMEVLSGRPQDAALDRIDKLRAYELLGVPWCWFVDPRERLFEVYSLRDGHYTWALGAAEGRVHVPGALGLEIDLDALWTLARA